MHRYATLVTLVGLFALPAAASAQEKGKVGITMGFPSAVGLVWHASETVALRPELSTAWGSADNDITELDSDSLSTGLSALFYLRKSDDLATYVSPRYAFSRSTTTARSGSEERETHVTSHLVSGSFGAHYFLGSRFSVFGELGLAYQRGSAGSDDDDDDDDDNSSHSFGTRSSVGIVFYF